MGDTDNKANGNVRLPQWMVQTFFAIMLSAILGSQVAVNNKLNIMDKNQAVIQSIQGSVIKELQENTADHKLIFKELQKK